LETTLGMPADELNQTYAYRGSAQNVGGKLKSTTNHWVQPNEGATNESGFTALPGGIRFHDFAPEEFTLFVDIGQIGAWWSSTANDANSAWHRTLRKEEIGVYRDPQDKKMGCCARCLRD